MVVKIKSRGGEMDIFPDIEVLCKAVNERCGKQIKSKERSRRIYEQKKEYFVEYNKKHKERKSALWTLWKWGITPNEDLIKTIIAYRKTKEDLNEYRNSLKGNQFRGITGNDKNVE